MEEPNEAPEKERKKGSGMVDRELLAIIDAQEKRALGYGDGELSRARSDAIKRYNGELYGTEVEGRSQVVTTEVFDTVEWILPSLLKVFTASDKAVEFEPERPSDEKGAKQSTTACNYVFYRQNPGFTILYSFFKDALLEKNGYVEVYYDKSDRKRKESYEGISREQLIQLVSRDGVELLAATSYPDPSYQIAPEMGQPDPMAQSVAGAMAPELYDVQIEVEEEYGRVCIENVAPEEMLIDVSHKDVDLSNCNFSARRFQKTISELEELGYDTSKIVTSSAEGNEVETSGEFLARKMFNEERLYTDVDSEDRTMRKVWVTKAFIRVDYDGDGVAELRRVVRVGNVVLENEETDVVPFASCTPIIQTHRHIGKSVAEIVMEIQKIRTTLTRQMLDNIYLTNAPRQAVQSTPEGAPLANLDDLLTVRPGGVVRYWGSQPPTPLVIPFMGNNGIQALEYMDTVLESRTGVTKYNQGLDANSLNKTARGINAIMTASQARLELIARIFAETGVKQIFRLIQHCLMTYHSKPMIMRLTDEYVEVDPREWSQGYDMVINVGLGTGDKDQQLVHLMKMAEAQFQFLQMGAPIVTMENIYNTQAKIAENAGFKNTEEFWTDPKQAQPQQQQADPAQMAAQQQAQVDQQKLQMEQQKAQADLQIKAQDSQQKIQLEGAKLQASRETEQVKLQAMQELEAFKAKMSQETELKKAALAAAASIEVARINAEQADRAAGMQAQVDAQSAANEAQSQAEDKAHEKNEASQAAAETSQIMREMIAELGKVMSAPKELIRGADGKAVGVRTVL